MTTIEISKNEVCNEVERRLSLEASLLPESYDAIWVSGKKKELLDGYWIEGCEVVISLLKRYLNIETNSRNLELYNANETLSIGLNMPDRYDENLDGSIETCIKMMIACNMVSGWMKVVRPEIAAKYDDESAGYMDELKSKILYRTNPERDFGQFKTDTESIKDDGSEFYSTKTDDYVLMQQWGSLCEGLK